MLAVASPASASHLDTMSVTASSEDLEVTLTVTFTTTGFCCGGTFQWTTGDGASGAVTDGISSGSYAGDASGSGSLSDGRPFTWTRTGSSTHKIEIVYSYTSYGQYTIDWQDSAPSRSGSLTVTLSPSTPPPPPCKYVGAEVPGVGIGGFVYVGGTRHNIRVDVPGVGFGVCIEEGSE